MLGGLVQTFYLLQCRFDGVDAAVVSHIRKQHMGGAESLFRGGRGDLLRVACAIVFESPVLRPEKDRN